MTDAVKAINTSNDYGLGAGQNLPNHSASVMGRGKFVRPLKPIQEFRDRQTAYRFAAHLITMAEIHLPNDDGCEEHDFESVRAAVQNA